MLPVSKGETIQIFFNDQLVETKALAADGPLNWTTIEVKANWHAGANTLRLLGHGMPVYPPNDTRPFLFRVMDPRKMIDATGKIVPQPAP